MVAERLEMIVEDMTDQPKHPTGKRDAQAARGLARRGYDIIELAQSSWPVCVLCDQPCWIAPGGSARDNRSHCCDGAIRVHGWAL